MKPKIPGKLWATATGATRNLLRKRFFRSVLILGGGTGLGQAITILAAPILTRLYTPSDFGLLAVYSSSLFVLVVLASFRYELAIPLPLSDDDAAALLLLSLGLVLLTTATVGLSALLFGHTILAAAGLPHAVGHLWLLPVGLFGAGIYQALSYWAIRKGSFREMATTRVTQSTAQVISQVLSGIFAFGSFGLLIGDAIGRAIGSGTLFRLANNKKIFLFRRDLFQNIPTVARRYSRFPLISSWSGMINTLGLHAPALLFATFYDVQFAGWFALGQRVVAAPTTLIGRAVAQVYLKEAAPLADTDRGRLGRLHSDLSLTLLTLSVLPFAIIASTAPWFFSIAFGKEWAEAGQLVAVITPAYLAQLVTAPLSQTLNVLERQDLQLAWDIGRFLLVLIAFSFARALSLSGLGASAILSGALTLSYAALFLLTRLQFSPTSAGGPRPPVHPPTPL